MSDTGEERRKVRALDTVQDMKKSVQMRGKKRQFPVFSLQGVNDELNS